MTTARGRSTRGRPPPPDGEAGGAAAPPATAAPATAAQLTLLYVYGFADGAGACPPTAGVERGARIEWVPLGGFGALVSSVPAGDYEEAPLAEHLLDPRWLGVRVERHNRVLLEGMRGHSVVPCRFATLFRSREALVRALCRQRRSLKDLLRRFTGKAEWAVKLFSPPPGPPAPSAAPSSSGTAYLLDRVRERSAAQERQRRLAHVEAAILGVLAEFCDQVVRLPLPAQGSDPRGEVTLNVACLAAVEEGPRIEAAIVHELEAAGGITGSCAGPMPAYSFVAPVGREVGSG